MELQFYPGTTRVCCKDGNPPGLLGQASSSKTDGTVVDVAEHRVRVAWDAGPLEWERKTDLHILD